MSPLGMPWLEAGLDNSPIPKCLAIPVNPSLSSAISLTFKRKRNDRNVNRLREMTEMQMG